MSAATSSSSSERERPESSEGNGPNAQRSRNPDSKGKGSNGQSSESRSSGGLATRWKVAIGLAIYFALIILVGLIVPSAPPPVGFSPVSEFELLPWIELPLGPIDMSINKAVFYVFLACLLTIVAMLYLARRMDARPNRVQTTVEAIYDLTRNQLTLANMDREMGARWFPLVAALFLFIVVSNLVGYIPLPFNTAETIDVGGFQLPTFAVYSSTANISVPLVLTFVVWFGYNIQGIARKGAGAYFRGWIPAGTPDNVFAKAGLLSIEIISHFVRLISLSVRLFANMLAGHLLILFMAGGIAVILGMAAVAVVTLPVAVVFFVFEVVLIAGLQAFIFAILTAIYIGEATEESH